MSDGTLLLILLVPAVLAFAFGIWAGLGYPGMYDKDAKTGKAPRESPLRWLLRGGRRPLTSEMKDEEDEEDEEDLEVQDSSRLSFDRGRRFRR
tara:strand:+ start:183 stop:461 length:279 start_codon:yes stop_codon:yes gene_type:complete